MRNKKPLAPIFSVLLASLILMPSFTYAAGLIPCGGSSDPCTLCHLIVGVHGLIEWGMKIITTAAVAGIVIAGVMYIASAGSPGMTGQAKNFLTASLIGFAVFFTAWLLVNVVLWLLSAKSDLGIGGGKKWNEFTCNTQSTALDGTLGGNPSGTTQCCVISETEGTGDYGKPANCPSPKPAKTKAECEQWCDDENKGATAEYIKECKSGCVDTPATCEQGKLTDNCSTQPACGGSASVGCGKVVDAARQHDAAGCCYCNTFSANPHTSSCKGGGADPTCQLNSCAGSPGYTDCSNFVNTCYKKASCSQPGGNASSMHSKAEAIGDKSSLKAGDVLTTPSHVVMCTSDGCSTVIHASGSKDGIKESNASYYVDQGAKVLRASKYCSSCN